MAFDLDADDSKPATPSTTPVVVERNSGYNLEEIRADWLGENELEEKLVCLLLGSDGTAKSGIALSYLTDEDIKNGYRCLVIDLDGGNVPLIRTRHKERCEKLGRKVNDVFLVRNPMEQDPQTGDIDYIKTYDNIKKAIFYVRNDWRKDKIKFIIFDGLSSALKFAEYQMRIDKNLAPDGGVQLRYWVNRNKLFDDTLKQIRALPISSFFIAHEDFILKEVGDNSKIKEGTNSMMHQKVKCERVDDKINKRVIFKATIIKTKDKTEKEGAEFEVLVVDKIAQKFVWNTKPLFDSLV